MEKLNLVDYKVYNLIDYEANPTSIDLICNDNEHSDIITLFVDGCKNELTRETWLDDTGIQLFNKKSIDKILDILERYVGFAEAI